MLQQLDIFEQYCETLYGAAAANVSPQDRQHANESLKQFTDDVGNLQLLLYFVQNSNSKYVQYLSLSALKQLITDNWLKVSFEQINNIKNYILHFLKEKGPLAEQQVLKMMLSLLSRIVKKGWVDRPEVRGVVQDLISLQSMGEYLAQISLRAINDLVLEMSYTHMLKNYSANRRTAMSFRDEALHGIFTQSISLTRQYTEFIITM